MSRILQENNLLNLNFLSTVQEDHVYVVGPGPNGQTHWHEIPSDSTVIFLNKAIELYHNESVRCKTAYWMVCETSVIRTEWFTKYRDAYSQILIVGRAVEQLGALYSHEYHKVFDYHGRGETDEIIDVVEHGLSIGTTIAGMGMQFGYHMGAKLITFCGIDMYGDKYWDGECGHYDGRTDKPWTMYANRIGRLMDRMKDKRKIQFLSLSKTELDVEIT